MTPAVDVIVPVWRRPHRIVPLVESFRASRPGAPATLHFVVDLDDPETLEVTRTVIDGDVKVLVGMDNPRTFPRKANLGYRETSAPWLLLCGDDVAFHRGWAWKALMCDRPGINLISTNDRWNPRVTEGRHAVHPLLRRAWIDEAGASFDGPGTVAHEGYRHWYVDEEWTQKALAEDCFAYARHAVIEHLHPYAGKAEMDDVYEAGRAGRHADRALAVERITRHLPHLVGT